MKSDVILIGVLIVAPFLSKAQDDSSTFQVDLEFRPRIEFRNGYGQLPADTTSPAYFGTQRGRLYLTYSRPKFKFHTSLQDVRVWGQFGQKSTNGSLSVFEAYVESHFNEKWSVILGRQGVELDNKRIFSKANWNQHSRAHDGFNFRFRSDRILSEQMFFFNQTSTPNFGTNFSPENFTNYKTLAVQHFKVQLSNRIALTTINAFDGYQNANNNKVMYVRGTSGGRIEYVKKKIYLTLSGYYQYGQLSTGTEVSAFYLQPEIKLKLKKLTTRLGMEYMSGDDASESSERSNSFVPLYGVAHSFMGHMDYFTKFPGDVKGGGIINPYLFLKYDVNKKLSFKVDGHLFYLQNTVVDSLLNPIDSFLGFENDISLRYKINDFITLDYEFSYLLASESMEFLKGGSSDAIPVWSYLMITFKPELFSHTAKINDI